MITFEQAKEIALSYVEGTAVILNSVYETDNIFIFDDEREAIHHTNIVPLVVSKDNGSCHGQFVYFNEHNIEWSDEYIKHLDYNTGERTGKSVQD